MPLSAARRDIIRLMHNRPQPPHLQTFSEWILNWENVSTFMKCLSLSFYCGFFPNSFQSPHLFRCFFCSSSSTSRRATRRRLKRQIVLRSPSDSLLLCSMCRGGYLPTSPRLSPSKMFSFHCFDVKHLQRYLRLYWLSCRTMRLKKNSGAMKVTLKGDTWRLNSFQNT